MKSYLLLVLLATSTVVKSQSEYAITVESRQPSGIIDEMLYGQLFEHIYFSANNGVWQELIQERSFEPEQITRYQEYAAEKAQNVYIILGIGGEPSMPEELYLIPIDAIPQIQSKPSLLKQFQREVVDKWFSIDEFSESVP